MEDFPELHFERDTDWYDWLLSNHKESQGVYLIFYKLDMNIPTMRWEEAVKVALCFGWIDSKVQSLGNGKRRQYFTTRKDKSVWSALNKSYIDTLISKNIMHESGLKKIETAKQNGSWTALETVEKGVIPKALQLQFDKHPEAFQNYLNFAPSYRKSYLYWLNSAKREETKQKRIQEIMRLCSANIKTR